MGTNINSNGSKWMGEEPDTVETLLEVLATEPLDRRFEDCGNFVLTEPELVDGTRDVGRTHFFGNFFTVSHVFNIDTDEPDIIERLTTAIRANQTRPDYLRQDAPRSKA